MTAAIDEIFAPLVTTDSPGVAMLVVRNGKTVFQRGYGVGDLRTMRRIDARTNFRLASFTKQFTAMAVMLLVKDGKLRYETPLTGIFPDFPAYGRNITVRHLLQHTSGLPDYEELMDEAKGKGRAWSPTLQIQDAEVLALLKQKPTPKFAAGSGWAYSNSGYVVLGLIAAEVSGMPFGEFLQRRVFQPLRMARTLVYQSGKNTVADRAYGHSKKASGFVETDQSSTSATLGDGGIYSNLEDLAKWDRALTRHKLLSETQMREALVPARLADGSRPPGNAYGYGWFLDPYKEHTRMWHSGTTTGFRTVIHRFPQLRLTVIVLCNRTDLDAAGLALRIVDAVSEVKRR